MPQAQQVVGSDYGVDRAKVTQLKGGIINTTYLVESPAGKKILQHMNSMFPTESTADFKTVTDHLRTKGWETPQLAATTSGELFSIVENGDWWRMMSFIESDGDHPESLDEATYLQAGQLLANLHRDLATLNYQPAFKIPHFHETEHYAGRLGAVRQSLTDPALQQLAADMLGALEALPEPPMSEPQLIHGDPQTSNMLFKSGKPFTFIDYDTVMIAPIWIDIGDMLRSLAEDAIEDQGKFPRGRIKAVVEGYRLIAAPEVEQGQFYQWAMVATQKIALELGMRFLIDVVEDNYFGFDADKFSSRRQSNIGRAQMQWKIYKLCSEDKDD
ncbi:MAG TPA: phosphotransferase [Methylomirabilota bacterium]|nr:phosphotransferase [Methylomirabilota bacterium]